MSEVGSLPHTASGAVVTSGVVRVRRGGSAERSPPKPEGTPSAPLLGAVHRSGPETATDSRSCSCALPLSDSTGLAPGSEARIRRRAATWAATSSATGGWMAPAKPSGRLAGCRLYWASACKRPATAWLTLSVSSCVLTRSTHPQDIFLAGLTLTPRLRAVGQGWRRGAVHCPRPTCASRAVF
eukprot:scaffold4869_cov123-Isochrysis_galbana.AAC.4